MKKIVFVTICSMLLVGCSGGGGVSQEQYESVVAERDSYKKELESMKQSRDEDNVSHQLDVAESESADSFGANVPKLSETELTKQVSITEYSYETDFMDTTWYMMEITNNSPVTISVSTNVIAKDESGNIIGAASSSKDAVESGYTVCLTHMFDNTKPESFSYTISVKEDEYYEPVLSDLSYEASDTGGKVIITCTNNGSEPAEFVEGLMLFFSGDELVGQSSSYFTDDDSELKPGNTIAKEFEVYNTEYDNFKFYLTGRR